MKKEVIVIHETKLDSIKKDLFSLVIGLAFIGFGVWLDSVAMQVVGIILFFVALAAAATFDLSKNNMTFDEAIVKIEKLKWEAMKKRAKNPQ